MCDRDVYVYLQLIIDNLKSFSASLTDSSPLFQVDTLLAVPDVILHPTTNDLYRFVLQCVRDCVEWYDRRNTTTTSAFFCLTGYIFQSFIEVRLYGGPYVPTFLQRIKPQQQQHQWDMTNAERGVSVDLHPDPHGELTALPQTP